jgi:translocation protein SEC66
MYLISEEAGYFPVNKTKLEYEELSEQYSPDDMNGKRVLTVALMQRAMEGVTRVMRLREEKPPLQQMVRDGVIGESLWEKLLAAEAELELEIQAV